MLSYTRILSKSVRGLNSTEPQINELVDAIESAFNENETLSAAMDV
jgi:hypothetical protein